MLFDTRRFGTLREIEMTKAVSILRFMAEYPKWKTSSGATSERMGFADEVEL